MRLSLVLGLAVCTVVSATPLENAYLNIPGEYEVRTPSGLFPNTLKAQFILTVNGGTPGGQVSADFSFSANLQADCQDNGYLQALANGVEVYYFDSCRQGPHLGGLVVTFGVPLRVSMDMRASAGPGPHSYPNAQLSGSLRLVGFAVYPDLTGPGSIGDPITIQFAEAPEPATLAPMAIGLVWFARRRLNVALCP